VGTVPTAPTFAPGESTGVAAKLNLLRDVLNFLETPPQCSAYATAAQTLTTSVATAINLDAETFDVVQSGDSPSHDNVTNNTRLVCRTAGKYEMVGQVRFNGSSSAGIRVVALRLNGATDLVTAQVTPVGGGSSTDASTPPIVYALAAGDYIEVRATQTSGGNLNTVGGAGLTFLRFRWISS
jgi:hypothetical protein